MSPSESPAAQPIGWKAVRRLYGASPSGEAAATLPKSLARGSVRPGSASPSAHRRARARASRSWSVSTPVTRAPREAAISSASPEPQPRESIRVPPATSRRSYTASYSGASMRSWISAQSRAREPASTGADESAYLWCRTSVGVMECAPIRREVGRARVRSPMSMCCVCAPTAPVCQRTPHRRSRPEAGRGGMALRACSGSSAPGAVYAERTPGTARLLLASSQSYPRGGAQHVERPGRGQDRCEACCSVPGTVARGVAVHAGAYVLLRTTLVRAVRLLR